MRHRSFCHEKKLSPLLSYERLEFLGDAVLQMAISRALFTQFPGLPEGELTALRSTLVCRPSLVEIAKNLDIGSGLRLGRGEDRVGGRQRPSTLADALEALLGAICLDSAFEEAQKVCLAAFGETLERLDPGDLPSFKNRLQETLARYDLPAPEYRLVACEGPGNQQTFVIDVNLGPSLSMRGTGPTKKVASQEAARLLLAAIDPVIRQPERLDAFREGLKDAAQSVSGSPLDTASGLRSPLDMASGSDSLPDAETPSTSPLSELGVSRHDIA